MRFVFVLLLLALVAPVSSAHATAPELRAFWVDAFHSGFKTPAQASQLVADAQRAGANTLIIQVRRRGDSYYRSSLEPVATDVAPGYDPLADVIAKAHARGIKVHGWVVSLPVWKDNYDQPDRRHVWYNHGLAAGAGENWLMLRDDGKAGECEAPNQCGYFLDPGHPAAADYTVNVLTRLVSQYDLDGLQLDYIRYPSPQFGYNPVSLQRFAQASGRSDRPAPTDPQWMQWRRDQVTMLVKRIYLNMLAIKPSMELSVAAIAWGGAPPDGDFHGSSPYLRTLQDWAGWLDAGYIDWALPMAYFAEGNAEQRGWYDGWIAWIKTHAGRRAAGVGIGAWLNTADQNLAQMRRALDGGNVVGAGLYSYAIPVAGDRGAFLDRLRAELWSDAAPAPSQPWKTQPQTGYLLGRVTAGGAPLNNAALQLAGPGGSARVLRSDGSGMFGDVDLAPGTWTLLATDAGGEKRSVTVTVVAGRVAQATLDLSAGSSPLPSAGQPAPEQFMPSQPDRAFGDLWSRTDLAVQRGQSGRSWMWGPKSYATGVEAYREAAGGRRTVQYWDKSRMEVSDPAADRSQLWFVTNGLLTKELVDGRMQVGRASFTQRIPSDTPVSGDPAGAGPLAPGYRAFARVASLNGDRRSAARTGEVVTATIDAHGGTGADAALARYGVRLATYDDTLGHNIPNVFTPFLNGLPLPWVFVMGYPIAEPYWTRASVGGKTTEVLVQLYERRVLTYTPGNSPAFQVEMGNVGQHYYRWRYGAAPWER